MTQLLLPVFSRRTGNMTNGTEVRITEFCLKALNSKSECKAHYETLTSKPEGFYECPFGFTSRNFFYSGSMEIITGIVAFPRFGTEAERLRAKTFPNNRVARETVEVNIKFVRAADLERANAIEEASKVLPQAFHELRKLNGAVLQNAEREISVRGESKSLLSIKGAAELMRNNFDILEALSNIEGMRALPLDSTVNLFDLALKMKGILAMRAADKAMHVSVNGERSIIKGSQKSFPIVLAVFLENAIKYGVKGTAINVAISSVNGDKARITVTNVSESYIDPIRCFERGVRFSNDVEGGGFGLYLANEIVMVHQGRSWCEISKGSVSMSAEFPLVTVITHR